MKRLVIGVTAGAVVALACDGPTSVPETGSIQLQVVTVGDPALPGGPAGAEAAGTSARVHLDSGRVIVQGPTATLRSVTPGQPVTIDSLLPGDYTLDLEGWEGDDIAYRGRITGVGVVVGVTTTSPPIIFAPDSIEFAALGSTQLLSSEANVDWTSSNTGVATVTNMTVTSVGNGIASIQGTLGTSQATVVVRVAQEVALVTLEPATATIGAGQTQQFTATAFDSNNTALAAELVTFLWISSDHRVAVVDQQGLATGVDGGDVTISAAGRGEPGSAALTVTSQVATQLAFTVQPTTAPRNQAISPAVEVEIRDAGGALVTSARDPVTIAIGTNPATGVLSGSKTVNAVGGVATFSGLSIDFAGTGYTLVASAGGLTGATSAAFDITPLPQSFDVRLLANSAYVNFSAGGAPGSEASNVLASLDSFGLEVQTFEDISTDSIIEVTNTAPVLVVPDLTGDLAADLTAEAEARIAGFVRNGGTIIFFRPGPGENALAAINSIFGITMTGTITAGPYDLNPTDAADTPFEDEAVQLSNLSGTATISIATLPVGSLVIYQNAGATDAAVSVIPEGDGQIIILGWDWFNAPPNGGAPANGWLEVLVAATQF